MKNIIIHFFYLFFSLFPIKRKQILFIDYYGAKYGDSPAALSEYIVDNHHDWKIFWAFNDPIKFNIIGVRKIKYFSLHFFFILATSKVLITNYRMPPFFKKRKGQKYLQTWHSSLRLKKIEKDAWEILPSHYVKMAQLDSKKIDLIVSGCKFSSNTFRNSFWYDGKILECGTPRIDRLMNITPKRIHELKKLLDIRENEKVMLYCPTFRQNEENKVFYLDIIQFYNNLIKAIPDVKWKILVRYHPHEKERLNNLKGSENILDLSEYSDVQDLIAIVDLIITDYSAIMFDATYLNKPCFLYVKDFDIYRNKERNLYFDINSLPYMTSNSQNELIYQIQIFNQEEYNRKIEKFLKTIGSFEKGKACEKVTKKLEEWIE